MRIFWSIFLIGVLGAGGCGDDDSTQPSPTPFSVNLTVTDPAGKPVEGLEARLHVFLPPEIWPKADKALASIPFTVADTSMVSVVVYDMDGNVVNTLYQDIALPVGQFTTTLRKDDEGNPLVGTHLYRCEMVAAIEGVEQYRGETFLTLYTSIDWEQRPLLGITDDQGQIRYDKRTEFPYLYNPGPQMSVNENGEPRGTFEFIDKVEITLIHEGLGLHLDQEVIIGEGRNTVNLVWDAKLASMQGDLVRDKTTDVGASSCEPILTAGDKYSLEYSIGPGYPNPFN